MSCEPVRTCIHDTISSWDKGSPHVVKASTSSSLLNLHSVATVISPHSMTDTWTDTASRRCVISSDMQCAGNL